MTDGVKIIAFPRQTVPSAEPDTRIAEMLDEIRSMAERGEVLSFGIAAEMSDGGMVTAWRRGDRGSVHALLGGLAVVQKAVIDDGLEHR
jgi:hypothetical protein